MIRLQRDRAAIPPLFLGPGREARILELFRARSNGTLKDKAVKKALFSSTRWKPSKAQLARETRGKCGFCEAPTSSTYFGDVEHFRPKADYWWLAYCYDNYLFSCRVCNGNKGEKHSVAGPKMAEPPVTPEMSDAQLIALAALHSPSPDHPPAIRSYDQDCILEDGALPNPYQQDPEALFEWKADDDLERVDITAKASNPAATRALGGVIDIVRLNRPELRTQRWQLYNQAKRLHGLSRRLTGTEKADLEDLIRSMTHENLPFSAMMRHFSRAWGLLP